MTNERQLELLNQVIEGLKKQGQRSLKAAY